MKIRSIVNVSCCLALLSMSTGVQLKASCVGTMLTSISKIANLVVLYSLLTKAWTKHRVLTRRILPTTFLWKACGSLIS